MNQQWSDEVKERYTKDQAFYAECSARGIQICQDTATVKLAIRNKPWVGLTDEDGNCKHCTDGCPACDARKLKELNT